MSSSSKEVRKLRNKHESYVRGIARRYSEDRWKKDFVPALDTCVAVAYLEPQCDFAVKDLEPDVAVSSGGTGSADTPLVVRVPPLAFLKTMAVLAWSAFRYPSATTTVDLFTGDVMSRTW
jgi:hypothetical protein